MKNYLSLVKFAHTLFALPFACIGFAYGVKAAPQFDWRVLPLMLLCMVSARNAGMSFNRYADRFIDARNPRTAKREIPRGVLPAGRVLSFCIINAAAFIAAAALLNPLCFYLSPVALALVLGYSYTKCFTWLCHLFLGLSLAIAPVGAYLAVTGAFAAAPLYFSAIVLFWTAGFDVLYALPDEEFDKQERLHSIPAAFGRKAALRLSVWLHVAAGLLVMITGVALCGTWCYWAGAAIFVALLAYQHCLVKANDLRRLNAAFFTTNGVASVLFALWVVAGLLT
ncbi:MAG: putative 4-hydroxybenzoate polyprenyltransferase [Prevotellaceae bacterium]|nr:putative 4-hydroxybenzoate polyprenyltransferase [Prevotellaceae bacterium]